MKTELPAAARADTVIRAERLILILLLLNIVVDLALRLTGQVVSWQSFLPLADRFADYFRFVVSFSGGEHLDSRLPALAEGFRNWRAINQPPGLAALHSGKLTHFHAPPLIELGGLLSVRLMQWVEPALLYLAICLGLLAYWARIAGGIARSRREWLAWVGLALFSYPMLMVAIRGNVYAGLTGLLVVHALVLAIRGRAPRLGAILLAVAVGMRPKAILFAAPLILLQRERWAVIVTLGIAGPLVSGAAMLAAHLLYPAYSISSFLAGLNIYYQSHVVNHWGVAFGSSLFGALVVLFGYRPGLDTLAMVPAGAIAAGALWLHWHGRLATAPYLFLLTAAYVLGSTIIADYHLFIFALPIAAVVITGQGGAGERIILLASALMLAPKNYLFQGEVSIQPVLNPLILLAASAMLLVLVLRPAQRPEADRALVPA